ncbi:transposase [Thiohalocapsa sp.]|jgi:transposase|uniref:transposase n=1 Tax=Thiohalocapsa sp. TaxID=2497641 RepID=UPI0025E93E8D|nr:transposase [Thiohalocapsa sp.]
MAKRRYSTVKCKQVDWAVWAEAIGGKRAVFAVDVAKEKFVASLQVAGGRTLVRVSWSHPRETLALLSGLEVWAQAASTLVVVMESSGVYGDALRWQLQQRGIDVHRVSAKRVHDSAEVYDGVPSLHDAKATELIGKLYWEGLSAPWPIVSEARREQLVHLRRLEQAKARVQRERNRLEALLARHWPELPDLLSLGSASLLRLVATYGGPAPLSLLRGGARKLLHEVGGRLLTQEKIEAVLASAECTLGMPCTPGEREQLRWQAEQVIEAQREKRQAERRLVREHTPEDNLQPMRERLGQVTSAVLLATQGDPRSYPSAASYCKGIGLNLKEHSSGKHRGQLTLTKRGPALARFYLYFAALRLIARDPVIKRWYALKTARPGAVKMKQVIELMRKLAKAFWHQANGHDFDVERLVNLKALTDA